MKQHEHICQICDSSYITTTQKNVEYVCNMCRDNALLDNDTRELPSEDKIDWELVTDCGNH